MALAVDAGLRARLGIAGATARLGPGRDPGELLAVVAFHGTPAPEPGSWPWEVLLESVPLAGAAAEREAILARDCSETERRELAGRPLQTLAGRLAAKRAIARAFAAAGVPPPPLAGIVIERTAREAPRLLPGATPAPPPLFSIAHTRGTAYAVAAPPPR